MMAKNVLILCLGSLMVICSWAVQGKNHPDTQRDPYLLVQAVASATFARMKTEQVHLSETMASLKKIVEEELMPHVDHQFSALKVLGKHFKKYSKQDITQFIQVFRDYLVNSYVLALGYYQDQSVVFEPPRSPFGSQRVAGVKLRVQ